MVEDEVNEIVDKFYEQGEIDQLKEALRTNFLVDLVITPEEWQKLGISGMKQEVFKVVMEFYKRKEERIGAENLAMLEKMASLQVIDEKWKDHLREMDDLKEGIHLRAYGQKDPIVEYKTEAFNMFVELITMINTETLGLVFKLFPTQNQETPTQRQPRIQRPQQMTLSHAASQGMGFEGNREPVPGDEERAQRGPGGSQPAPPKAQPVQVGEKIGRNDPCPCGSGKKYKQCHGK
jgi:preprotein translocase subunit SecA